MNAGVTHQLIHRLLTGAQDLDDTAPRRVGKCVENICVHVYMHDHAYIMRRRQAPRASSWVLRGSEVLSTHGGRMDTRIESLVEQFERGGLSRRDLIKGLSLLVAAGGVTAADAQPAGLRGTRIDH